MNIRDQILSANDVRIEPVEVPEWGCTVYYPVLSITEAAALAEKTKGERADAAARDVAYLARDEHGNRIFADADVPALAAKSARAVRRFLDAFSRANFGQAGEAEKN